MKPWFPYFDLGFVYQTLYLGFDPMTLSVFDTLQPIIEDDFFQAIELTKIEDPVHNNKIKKLIEKAGKSVVFSGVTPIFREGLNLSDLSEEKRKNAVQRLFPLFDEAHEFNARVFLIASGPDPGKAQRENAKEQLKHSIMDLWEYGEKLNYNKDTTLSMEIFDRDVEIRFLFGPTAEASQFVRALRAFGINFSLTIDQGHLYLLKEEPSHSLHEAKGLAFHFHLGNCVVKDTKNPAFGAKHPVFGFPGGEVGYREISSFLSLLKGNQYFDQGSHSGRPILSFEVRPVIGEGPIQIFHDSKEEFLIGWNDFKNSLQKEEGR
jgi:sugar phosphate isomerase/epimerase